MKEFALSLAIMLGSVSGFAVSASPALAQDMSNGVLSQTQSISIFAAIFGPAGGAKSLIL